MLPDIAKLATTIEESSKETSKPEAEEAKAEEKTSAEESKQEKQAKKAWRSEIKEGDKLDMRIRYDDKSSLEGWTQVSVVKVSGDDLDIRFDLLNTLEDMKINRQSPLIARFETKTKEDHEWRTKNLIDCKENFNVDCHDREAWWGSSILKTMYETKNGRKSLMALVGFRVYTDKVPAGKPQKKDSKGTYHGWSEKFDEWIPAFSPRIQPFGTREGKPDPIENDLDDSMEQDSSEKGKQFSTSALIFGDPGKQLVVCTPYGYAEVDIANLKLKLEEDAKQSLVVREAIAEFVKEKELALQLDLETKEKEEEKEEKKEGEEKKEEEKDKEPELYCRLRHRLVKCLGRDTCPYGGGAMCDLCGRGINLDAVDQKLGFYRCPECKYDLCTPCSYNKQALTYKKPVIEEGVCLYTLNGKMRM